MNTTLAHLKRKKEGEKAAHRLLVEEVPWTRWCGRVLLLVLFVLILLVVLAFVLLFSPSLNLTFAVMFIHLSLNLRPLLRRQDAEE